MVQVLLDVEDTEELLRGERAFAVAAPKSCIVLMLLFCVVILIQIIFIFIYFYLFKLYLSCISVLCPALWSVVAVLVL